MKYKQKIDWNHEVNKGILTGVRCSDAFNPE
jgi:hypothetical protein